MNTPVDPASKSSQMIDATDILWLFVGAQEESTKTEKTECSGNAQELCSTIGEKVEKKKKTKTFLLGQIFHPSGRVFLQFYG